MEFVNFNIAKALDEKGFKEPCFCFYYMKPTYGVDDHQKELIPYFSQFRGSTYRELLVEKYGIQNIYNAPTIDKTINWLAENKQIYIDIITAPTFASRSKVGYIWQIKRGSDGSTVSTEESQEMFIHKSECKTNAIEFALTLL